MIIMTQGSHQRAPKKSSKKIASESDLKGLLHRCKDNIDKCLSVLPEGTLKDEAENLLADTEDVLDSEYRRVTIIVEEVLGKAVDIAIPEWHASELILLPLHKIPKEFQSLLVKGAKLYVHINIEAKNASELLFRDFEVDA